MLPEHTIAVKGVGLCALDIVSLLTLGRGGSLHHGEDKWVPDYIASGHEPNILLLTQSGLLYRSRPDFSLPYKPYHSLLFSSERLLYWKQKPNYSIDFKEELLPLIHLEMRACYVLTAAEDHYDKVYESLSSSLRFESGLSLFCTQLEYFEKTYGQFDLEQYLYSRFPEKMEKQAFSLWANAFLLDDLIMAKQGVSHPVKAALEVWRFIRPQLRELINFDRLTLDSNMDVYNGLYSLVRRSVDGAELMRHQLLLALIKQGIVKIDRVTDWQRAEGKWKVICTDKKEYEAEHFIYAQLNKSGPLHTNSSLLQCLIRLGLMDTCDLAEGKRDNIQVNREFQLISSLKRGGIISGAWGRD